MAAFIDEIKKLSPCQYICFVCVHWECCVSCEHSQLLLQTLKDLTHVSMVHVFHVFQLWWWCCKFPWALGVRMFFLITFCLVLIHQHQFPVCLRGILLSTRLRISDFKSESSSTSCLVALTTSFLSIGMPQVDQISQTSWRDFLTPLLAQHQTWFCFRRWRAFIRSRLPTYFWHGALLSNLIRIVGRKLLKWLQELHREIHNVEHPTHLLRNFLWSECQRVGLWC